VSRPIAIIGPTGTGKSALALEVAERVGGEVVNADAMQLYRGMDIGTAKLTPAERRGIPHHQLDVLDVTQTATVARYQEAAAADVDPAHRRPPHRARARGRRADGPTLCGVSADNRPAPVEHGDHRIGLGHGTSR
jgi:hypothetical protein